MTTITINRAPVLVLWSFVGLYTLASAAAVWPVPANAFSRNDCGHVASHTTWFFHHDDGHTSCEDLEHKIRVGPKVFFWEMFERDHPHNDDAGGAPYTSAIILHEIDCHRRNDLIIETKTTAGHDGKGRVLSDVFPDEPHQLQIDDVKLGYYCQ